MAYAQGVRIRNAAASTAGDIEISDLILRLHVTAFLELMGVDPSKCDDPFQHALFSTTLRRDFNRSAKKYAGKRGGKKAVARMMQKWLDANGDRLDELSAPAEQEAKSPRPSGNGVAGEHEPVVKIRLATDRDSA